MNRRFAFILCSEAIAGLALLYLAGFSIYLLFVGLHNLAVAIDENDYVFGATIAAVVALMELVNYMMDRRCDR